MSYYRNRLKYVTPRVWGINPEDASGGMIDYPELKMKEISGRKNTGIAFSGGGTRSASAVMGQLRGLNELGLLKHTRYLSCVSGASWSVVPFSYLLDEIDDKTFLGPVLKPKEITLDNLDEMNTKCLGYAISNSLIMDDFIKEALKGAGDETFSRAIGDIFLKPFYINSLKKFYSWNRRSTRNILKKNPNMKMSDFYLVNTARKRPYLLVGGTILRQDNRDRDSRLIHFEFTPLYSGASGFHRGAGSGGRDIGGGFVEPFGLDSDSPEKGADRTNYVTVRLGHRRHRMTLSDVIGTSGAAPAGELDKLHLDWVGFPEFKYWCPETIVHQSGSRAKEYEFGDGGILENLGIMPLLRRKVENIILFVNTRHELKGRKDIADSIPPLFNKSKGFSYNHVFEGSKFKDLVEGLLTEKRAGRTVQFKDSYTVLPNTNYGITGGETVNVLWIYNEQVAAWQDKLPTSVSNAINDHRFGRFPRYATFFENFPRIIDLTRSQVNLLAHLSCWNVLENRKLVKSMF